MSLYVEALYLFFVYAVLGWVVEVVFHVISVGKFINRGFLKGPYCPIYGFGMLLILYILTPFMNNILILFLLSMLLTTLLELVGGYLLEHFLHKRWWDYSNLPFNYKGYICLKFSIYWGIGALIVVKFVHPVIDSIYRMLPLFVTEIFVSVFAVMMLIDFITTLNNVFGLNKQLKDLDEIEKKIEKLSDDVGEIITDSVMKSEANKKKVDEKIDDDKEALDKKFNEKAEEIAKKHKRIIKAFPTMKEKQHEKVFEKLKDKIDSQK